jgi:hypothetical protein
MGLVERRSDDGHANAGPGPWPGAAVSFWITRIGDTTLSIVSVSRIVRGKVTESEAIVVPDDLLPRM